MYNIKYCTLPVIVVFLFFVCNIDSSIYLYYDFPTSFIHVDHSLILHLTNNVIYFFSFNVFSFPVMKQYSDGIELLDEEDKD
jgi:hypothetical protein